MRILILILILVLILYSKYPYLKWRFVHLYLNLSLYTYTIHLHSYLYSLSYCTTERQENIQLPNSDLDVACTDSGLATLSLHNCILILYTYTHTYTYYHTAQLSVKRTYNYPGWDIYLLRTQRHTHTRHKIIDLARVFQPLRKWRTWIITLRHKIIDLARVFQPLRVVVIKLYISSCSHKIVQHLRLHHWTQI